VSAEDLVSVKGLTKRFIPEAKPALDALDANVPPGRITGLVGPDGAGKTTLIRLMAGLLMPDEGAVVVLGRDMPAAAAEVHREMGYMPQQFGLYEDLSVMENLKLYADLRGLAGKDRGETFARLLEFTDLARFTDRRAGRLSGGMKQKLGLACALIRRPRLLLLDEPSVGVDPISRRELWNMVRELLDEGIGVVWSTSYLDEAEQCDRVIVLSEGKPIFTGDPADLTGRLSDRSFQVRDIEGNRRQVLARALNDERIIDGVIQGASVRLVSGEGEEPPSTSELGAGKTAEIVSVAPRFEDAFVDALGGGPGGRSKLAERMKGFEKTGETVIEADGLTKKFGDFTAAADIAFSIARGEIFGLLGPNGAGKSTTFKMMCGLLKPTQGSGRVAGHDLLGAPAEARGRLGYMAQKFSLYGSLSVAQNLEFFAGVYGLVGRGKRKAVDGMVEIFQLERHLAQSAADLPLGFKQRLALSCAAMHDPEILFLDEPTSGVDPLTRREFWTHINGMVEKGVTVMITTHFMDEAEYCDRIGLVYRGRILTIGTPDELKSNAASEDNPEPTLEEAFIEIIRRRDESSERKAA
jgi:ABC-2 type transport system ATP-binding protein